MMGKGSHLFRFDTVAIELHALIAEQDDVAVWEFLDTYLQHRRGLLER